MIRFLWRGPLESCNYGCTYCPFAKKVDARADLARDRAALERFVGWIGARTGPVGILFTPWGEGLVRRAYQEAIVTLSRMEHVERVAIQTNLSGDLAWTARARPAVVGIWATYHPEWTTRAKLVAKVRRLRAAGIAVSVGAVGLRRFATEIEQLRAELPADVYLWINAAKRQESYSEADLARFEAIDPHFRTNTVRHPSLGKPCRAGADVVSVDGAGDVRRCHFVDEVIGNLYDGSFDAALRERPCPNATCGCHIGYVHLDELDLYRTYGSGILERIPRHLPLLDERGDVGDHRRVDVAG